MNSEGVWSAFVSTAGRGAKGHHVSIKKKNC